jgi:cytochrome c-type biogenesis protein CcmH
MRRVAALLVLSLTAMLAGAVDSGQRFANEADQARYERLIRDLRCLVCRSESIADSNATLAADLRREVERLMREGKSDSEIYDFMTARYGDFVLMRPPVAARTWLLWAGPALFLAGGLAIVLAVVRRRSRAAAANPATLDEEPDGT